MALISPPLDQSRPQACFDPKNANYAMQYPFQVRWLLSENSEKWGSFGELLGGSGRALVSRETGPLLFRLMVGFFSPEGKGASTNLEQDSEAPAPEKKHQGRRWQAPEELGKMTKPDKATIKIHAFKISLI